MALYAFDGTGNEDHPGTDPRDTNVRKFFEIVDANNEGPGGSFYVAGVGTRKGWFGKIWGGLTGAGANVRLDEAADALMENVSHGDEVVDVVGFSRGAAMALEFTNRVNEIYPQREIRFVGLWDAVASFGVPGNSVNLGHNLELGPGVMRCYHALALDERRKNFPLTRVVQDTVTYRPPAKTWPVWFRGYHSDVGGGNGNTFLSNISLAFMLRQGKACGLPIDQKDIDRVAAQADASMSCKRPLDLLPNAKRAILSSDYVHKSVAYRKDADGFDANNVPKWIKVVSGALS